MIQRLGWLGLCGFIFVVAVTLTGENALTHGKSKKRGSWNFHGRDLQNTADSSSATNIKKSNIDDLEIKWIYNIDELQGTNAVGAKTRALNFPAQGVAIDKKGDVFVPTFDGRIHILKTNKAR